MRPLVLVALLVAGGCASSPSLVLPGRERVEALRVAELAALCASDDARAQAMCRGFVTAAFVAAFWFQAPVCAPTSANVGELVDAVLGRLGASPSDADAFATALEALAQAFPCESSPSYVSHRRAAAAARSES